MNWLAVFALPLCVLRGPLPDAECTPGKPHPLLSAERICAPEFRTGDYRKVSRAKRARVIARYGMADACAGGRCEIDHLIPLECGGSNDLANLFPQPFEPRPGAHEKDALENRLHRLLCEGKLTLEQVQEVFRGDWVEGYNRYVNQ